MNVYTMKTKWLGGIAPVVLGCFAVLAAGVYADREAAAHEGHSGPVIEFMEVKEALKAVLPQGGKIVQRKQEMTGEAAARARRQVGAPPLEGVQTFLLTRDEAGRPLGAAMNKTFKYGHGEVVLAIGVRPDGTVTGAAVVSTHRKYVAEIKKAVGAGMITGAEGIPANKLATLKGTEGPAAEIMGHLARMTATLLAATHGVK